jgi:AraC-like DNA-binding protein
MKYDDTTHEPLCFRLHTPVPKSEFKFTKLKKKQAYTALDKDYNHLLFLLEGELMISCNEFTRRLCAGEFVLIPVAADIKVRVVIPSRILTVGFEEFFSLTDVGYKYELIEIASTLDYNFTPVTIRSPLDKFIENFTHYMKKGINLPLIQELKLTELAIIMRESYTKEEMASLFYPVAGRLNDFRLRIMRSYRKVNHIDDLATLLGMEKRTFTYYFKEEFGISPYQWMLKQKAKHIYFSLTESRQTIPEICKEYGFVYTSHFNLFCKKYLHSTPQKVKLQHKSYA